MSRLRGNHKGQVAIEMLFVLAVILTGIVLVVPVYLQGSGDSLMLVAVRDASAHAAAYIETGVVIDSPVYRGLNIIIANYTAYRSVGFKFVGVTIQSEDDVGVRVLVKFSHDLGENSTRDEAIAENIGKFLKAYLSDVNGFMLDGEHLYYRNKLVVFNVTVGETSEVIP